MYKKLIAVAVLSAIFSVGALFAQSSNETQSAPAVESKASVSGGIRYIAAALAACIGGGMAVGKIGAAAMGAMSENANLSGKALPFVGLAEGICLWGFLIGFLIIN